MKISSSLLSIVAVTMLFTACSSNANNEKSSEDYKAKVKKKIAEQKKAKESAPAKLIPNPFDITGLEEHTTNSGLTYYLVEKVDSGITPKPGQVVNVHYTGYLKDGTKFDSSYDRGKPLPFTLGAGQVIKGWDEGVALLKVGEKARLVVPSYLAYGERGYPNLIPANATLVFDVKLVSVE